VHGLEDFKGYVRSVRAAFPDFHNTIQDLIAEGDRVVARLTYRGTHGGELFGIAPTGRHVVYTGIAIFRLTGGKIVDGWVLGDALGLMQQMRTTPARGPDVRRES
jgi:predicted ester cyclase